MHADEKLKRHFNLFIFWREHNDFFIQTGNVNWPFSQVQVCLRSNRAVRLHVCVIHSEQSPNIF